MASERLARTSRPRLISYAVVVALAFQVATLILVVPLVPLDPRIPVGLASVPGAIAGVAAYFRRSHVAIEFDDAGFKLKRGAGRQESYQWKDFQLASVTADTGGELYVRLYYEQDGLYLDVPVQRAGGDVFDFRAYALQRIKG